MNQDDKDALGNPMSLITWAIKQHLKENPPAWESSESYLTQWERVVRSLSEQLGLTPSQTFHIALAFSELAYDAAMLVQKGDFDDTKLAVGFNRFSSQLAAEARFES